VLCCKGSAMSIIAASKLRRLKQCLKHPNE
jgi:hypothetical protein